MAKQMPIGIFYRTDLEEYDFGPGHPFRGDRYRRFPKFLKEILPENQFYKILKGEPVNDEDLSLICHREYIDFTRDYYRSANLGRSHKGPFSRYHSPDNRPIGRPGKLEEAARLIVGQAKMAADLIQGECTFQKVVSLGGGMHHAKPSYGEGFCIYNDVAFTAIYLMKEYKLERILILDTDAHAGNGTLEYFYSTPKVLFVDIHQDPRTLYPGTGYINQVGDGDGRGYSVNVPLPIYAGYDSYHSVFEEIIFPLTEEFKPQFIIRNGGSDPHFADELTYLGLSMKGFKMIGEKVSEMAARTCGGKVVDLIGSGYNKEVLPYGWLALISGLAGFEISIKEPLPVGEKLGIDASLKKTEKVIKEVKMTMRDYWKCF